MSRNFVVFECKKDPNYRTNLRIQSAWNCVPDRTSLNFTLNDLSIRKFPLKVNIPSVVPASFMSFKIPYIHVKSFAISKGKKTDANFSLFIWDFFDDSKDKRWSIVVRLALPPHCSVYNISFYVRMVSQCYIYHYLHSFALKKTC